MEGTSNGRGWIIELMRTDGNHILIRQSPFSRYFANIWVLCRLVQLPTSKRTDSSLQLRSQ